MIRALATMAALLAIAGPALAGEPLLDYRRTALRDAPAASTAADRASVARALAEDAPPAIRQELGRAFVVLGSVAVSGPGARERIHLVQEREPVAIDPFPTAAAPVLVATGPTGPARFWRLPADAQYRRLAAAVDLDGDGRSEVLLESSFMNMGELATALTAVRLDPATPVATPVQVLPAVATDACDGGRSRRRTGSTVAPDGAGRLVARSYGMPCR